MVGRSGSGFATSGKGPTTSRPRSSRPPMLILRPSTGRIRTSPFVRTSRSRAPLCCKSLLLHFAGGTEMAEAQPPHGERTRMSPETFTQQWAQIRQHLQGWWDQLTEQDLDQIAGQQDQLVRVIQERYQFLRERAQDEVDRRLQAYQTAGSPMAEALIAAAEEAASRLRETAEQERSPAAGTSLIDRY